MDGSSPKCDYFFHFDYCQKKIECKELKDDILDFAELGRLTLTFKIGKLQMKTNPKKRPIFYEMKCLANGSSSHKS